MTSDEQQPLQQPAQSDIATTPKKAMDASKPSSAVDAAMAEAFPADDSNAAADEGWEDEEPEAEEEERPPPEGAIEDVPELVEEGARNFALREFEAAQDQYSRALEIITYHQGQWAPEAGPIALAYGRVLLEKAIQKSHLLGGAESKAINNAADEDVKAEASSKASSRFVFQGDGPEFDVGPASGADVEEAAGDEEGEDEDLGLAWEILDLARMIFEKAPSKENKQQLADVHILLGDISLESEMFEQAISEFEIAVEMKESYLAPNNRQLAEANWKLGLALEYSKKFPEAIESFKKALAALEAKRDALQSTVGETSEKGKEAASAEVTENQAELKEVEDLLPELRTKIDDLTQAETRKETESNGASSPLDTTKPASAEITDVSSLVKKRKAEPEDNNESKKTKTEEKQ
ncbi:hypothetical protein HK097_004296 [Rhizophlyctis rosea]|uniref:Tetratricopeptide SHNi-TPR domain-containing protein n=1 Tax=Rhizophlyctis rosea TaxID=64517 RepID=A0AAD5S3E9_9FUNG|nr:hypothetical protein HK097_004296 [Rhizophlyctis rosea]